MYIHAITNGSQITNVQTTIIILVFKDSFTDFIPPHRRVGSAAIFTSHLPSIVPKKHLVLFHVVTAGRGHDTLVKSSSNS